MIWTGIVFVSVSYFAFFIAWVLFNVPLPGEGGWTGSKFFAKTDASPRLSVGLGVVGTCTDFYTIAIPLMAISGLNMSRGKKIGVSALFATGLLYATYCTTTAGSSPLLIMSSPHRACSFSAAGLASRLDNYRQTVVRGYPDPFWTSMPAYALA